MKNLFLTAIAFIALAFASQAQPFAIGDKVGGGVVFHITDGGMHGLIAATKDHGKLRQSEAATFVNDTSKHSAEGKLFNDWRLPNLQEIGLLTKQMAVVGGFTDGYYWSSVTLDSSRGKLGTLVLFKSTRGPGNGTTMNKPSQMEAQIRVIRSF